MCFYEAELISGEPVSYIRISLDELNTQIKMVDRDGSEEICGRFASREDVNIGDILSKYLVELKQYDSFGISMEWEICALTQVCS